MSYCFQGSLYALGIMHMLHIQVLCRAVHHLEIKKKKDTRRAGNGKTPADGHENRAELRA